MDFIYNKKKDRKNEPYIEINGGKEGVKRLLIPEEIEGIPVKGIGSSAFSRRKEVEEAVLPPGIYSLGRYAFYNCTGLKKLTLCDGVEDYYDGVIKQCESLAFVDVHLNMENYTVVKDLLADNDRTLHFTFYSSIFGGEEKIKLTFPSYVYDFVEDVEARVLHHKIEGAGYPYRECVTRKGIDFRAYDGLFYQAVTDDRRTAADIAFDRLMYPYELENGAKENYEQYLLISSPWLITELIEENNFEKISLLLEQVLVTQDACQEAIDFSVEKKRVEYTAMFMEYDREHFHRNSQDANWEDSSSGKSGEDSDADTDTDSGTDSGIDSDVDSDTDSGADSGADSSARNHAGNVGIGLSLELDEW